jgi:hypothetical protein
MHAKSPPDLGAGTICRRDVSEINHETSDVGGDLRGTGVFMQEREAPDAVFIGVARIRRGVGLRESLEFLL